MTQCLRATNLAARTGRSHTSKVLAICWGEFRSTKWSACKFESENVTERTAYVVKISSLTFQALLMSQGYHSSNQHINIRSFPRITTHLWLEIPNMDVAIVERCEHPVFRRVQIHAFHAIRTRRQLLPEVQPQRHDVSFGANNLGFLSKISTYKFSVSQSAVSAI